MNNTHLQEHLHGMIARRRAGGNLCVTGSVFLKSRLAELSHLGRGIFFNLGNGVDNTQDEDGGANVERPFYGVGNLSGGSNVLDSQPCEKDGEDVAHERTGVAQERLDAVGLGLLFLVNHVANHHLERLHCHVDAGVQEHERDETEGHGGGNGKTKAAGVGQHAHHYHCHCGTHQQVGDAAAQTSPRLVAEVAHQRLDYHAHERRQNPEVTEVVRVGTQGSKNAADVGTLQCIGDLHTKETETDVYQRR